VYSAWPANKLWYQPGCQNKQGGSFPQKKTAYTKVVSNSAPLGTIGSETKMDDCGHTLLNCRDKNHLAEKHQRCLFK
jgi:hypothetical protein